MCVCKLEIALVPLFGSRPSTNTRAVVHSLRVRPTAAHFTRHVTSHPITITSMEHLHSARESPVTTQHSPSKCTL
jgi:hypothetical protein